jgi:hypothetical protein
VRLAYHYRLIRALEKFYVEKFYAQMSTDDHVMCYPFMVIGGVLARKLRDVP